MKKVLNSLKMFLCLTLCLVIIAGTTGAFEVNTASNGDAGTEILGDDSFMDIITGRFGDKDPVGTKS